MINTSTFSKAALAAWVVFGSAAAQAQTFELSADGTPQSYSFAAGTYTIQFVTGGANFTAYSLRDTDSNPATVTPQQSFRTLSSFTVGTTTTNFGFVEVFDPSRNNGAGGLVYKEYPTISAALAAANDTPIRFTLTAPTDVSFRVADTKYDDNSFGVTLSVSAVPEPSTYAMMFAGLAMTGFVARRRRSANR